jgi:hypothetical protein
MVIDKKTPIAFNTDRTMAAMTDGAASISIRHLTPDC